LQEINRKKPAFTEYGIECLKQIIPRGRSRLCDPKGQGSRLTFYMGFIDPLQTILSLALIDKRYAEPGTEVRCKSHLTMSMPEPNTGKVHSATSMMARSRRPTALVGHGPPLEKF
jgi:hypothetical protein